MPLLRVTDCARLCGCARSTIYRRLARLGHPITPGQRLDTALLIALGLTTPEQVERFLTQTRPPPATNRALLEHIAASLAQVLTRLDTIAALLEQSAHRRTPPPETGARGDGTDG